MTRSICRALAATASASLACGVLSLAPAQAADDVTINLVAINDFHGQIDGKVVQWAATVEQLLAEGSADNTLLLSAGDNVGESAPASEAQDDEPAIDVLNLLGVDASAVGNHEFDKGYDDLVNRIMERAEFPILGANVKKTDGSDALDASTTYTVSGVKIAVIGAVTESTPQLVNPAGIAGLTFGEPVTAINAEVDRLNALPAAEQPDVIVAMIHEGAPWGTWSMEQAMQSSVFARMVEDTSPDVDAIITGHTHNTYVYDAPVPGDQGRTRPMIQTGFHGQNVGQIKLTVNSSTGAVKAYTARNVARVTTSDSDLIPTNPKLATVAQIRDDAVVFAAARSEEATAAKQQYDAALVARDEAYANVASLKDDYDAAVDDKNAAIAAATTVKARYDAAVADGKAAYDAAATIKAAYDAAAAEGKAAYAAAATVKQAYDVAVAEGRAAYASAGSIKAAYDTAVADGKAAYASAATIRTAYDAAAAEGKAAYATAATVKQVYDAAIAEGKAAYATATEVKQEYLATQALGDPDANLLLPGLLQRYLDALAAGDAAYARATATKADYDAANTAGQLAYARASVLKADYDTAVAAGKAAYARAAAMKTDFDAALAAGASAYTRAGAMRADYDTAVSNGQKAYAKASAMLPSYQLAVSTGQAAYANAATIKPDYEAAVAAVDQAGTTVSAIGDTYDAAVDTLNAAMAAVASLLDTLLGLL